jgi:hypothetical protein
LVCWKDYRYEKHSWVNEVDAEALEAISEFYHNSPIALGVSKLFPEATSHSINLVGTLSFGNVRRTLVSQLWSTLVNFEAIYGNPEIPDISEP